MRTEFDRSKVSVFELKFLLFLPKLTKRALWLISLPEIRLFLKIGTFPPIFVIVVHLGFHDVLQKDLFVALLDF